MSLGISSYDPDTQEVLDAIARHDNRLLRQRLETWIQQKGQQALCFDDFFLAACEKSGAGVVRILIEKGFTCSKRPLELAAVRSCWSVVKAMLPGCPPLSPPWIAGPRNVQTDHVLLRAIAANQPVSLGKQLLDHHTNPRNAAQEVLRCLSEMIRSETDVDGWVDFLVSEGAVPALQTPSLLQQALSVGEASLALALIRHGVAFSEVRDASSEVMGCVYKSRDFDTGLVDQRDRISKAGWDLLGIACDQGVQMPPVKRTPWPHVEGFDRHTGRLCEVDAAALEALVQRWGIERQTPIPSNPPRPPRF